MVEVSLKIANVKLKSRLVSKFFHQHFSIVACSDQNTRINTGKKIVVPVEKINYNDRSLFVTRIFPR